jgi:hypothetical protein
LESFLDLCHTFVAVGLIGVWLLHNKAFLLSAYSLFHTPFLLYVPFLLRATSTIPDALYVLLSFHEHLPKPGLPPFRLPVPLVVQVDLPILYSLVAIFPSHLSSSPICMTQFTLPSHFDAL